MIVRIQGGGLCDSPLERGVGVCYVGGLTHPRSNTSNRTPYQEGSYGLQKSVGI